MNKLSVYLSSLRTPNVYFNISYAVMIPMMVTLPFTAFFMWPIGIALMVLWVCQWNWREKWENFKQNDGIPYGFFLLGICLIPILGLPNSTNKSIAWSVFEGHLWFFFTPLIFLTTSSKLWTRKHINTLLILFSASEIVLLLYFFIRGIYNFTSTGKSGYMFNDLYCYNWHHAYVSLYATFVYTLIFYYLTENSHSIPTKRKILLYLIAVFLTISILLLYSRSGILIFLFMHLIWGGYAIYRKPSRWKPFVGIILLIFSFFTILIFLAPSNRFTGSYLSFEHENNKDKKTDKRLIIWQAAWDGTVENLPWGVGTGDGDNIIMEKYHENGHWLNEKHPYNAHNQILSALLTNGIPGLILVLLYFYAPLGLAIKHRDILMFSLFLLMFLNCLVECMFDRRAGVDFFAVMIPLLMLRCKILSNVQCTMYNVQIKIHKSQITNQ